MDMTILPSAFMAYCALNLVTFLSYWWDKQSAIAGRRRISEQTLHLLALAGGSAGAIAGQQFLRHKTRKEPFRSILRAICIFHGLVGLALLYLLL